MRDAKETMREKQPTITKCGLEDVNVHYQQPESVI
jgi:hypothetical protein